MSYFPNRSPRMEVSYFLTDAVKVETYEPMVPGGVGGWVAIKDAGIDVTLFASAETLHRVGRELMDAATHIQKWRDAEQLVEDIEEASSASDVVTKLNEFTDKWRQDNATKGGSDE